MSIINFDSCRICLSDFADDQDIIARVHGEKVIPHDYHEKCLDTWVKTRSKMSHSCPTCHNPLTERNVTFFKRVSEGHYVQISHAPLDLSQPIEPRSSEPSRFVQVVFAFVFVSMILLLATNPPSDDWATRYFNLPGKFSVYPEYQPKQG